MSDGTANEETPGDGGGITPPSLRDARWAKRFQASWFTLAADRFMNWFIAVGGVAVIATVTLIFVFILYKVLPLFKGAEVTPRPTMDVQQAMQAATGYREVVGDDIAVLGIDQWSELPMLVTRDGQPIFVRLVASNLPAVEEAALGQIVEVRSLAGTGQDADRQVTAIVPPIDFLDGAQATCVSYLQESQQLVYGTSDGRLVVVDINYRPVHRGNQTAATEVPASAADEASGDTSASDTRTIVFALTAGDLYPIGLPDLPLLHVAYGGLGENKVAAAIQDVAGERRVHAILLREKKPLWGAAKIMPVTDGGGIDLTALPDEDGAGLALEGIPEHVLVSGNGDYILVATRAGDLFSFHRIGEEIRFEQRFRPFADGVPIASIDWVFGDNSISLTDAAGHHVIYSIFMPEDGDQRLWGQSKTMPRLPTGATFHAPSLRNKALLIGADRYVSLRYSTTADTRWERELDYLPIRGVLSSKYDRVLLLGDDLRLHLYDLNDPHPEAGFSAYFTPIWYEGGHRAEFKWQSSAASDDYEMKLSMIPLIVGTLKGTFYALIFAVPIALLSAVYVSQFMRPEFKALVKPTMEIMASLPSVVLGFLAALWLAPLMGTQVPAFLLFVVAMPLVAMAAGYLWSRLPKRIRIVCPDGYEFLGFLPIVLLTGVACGYFGPIVERHFFVVEIQGTMVADFRLWWPQFTGMQFQEKNALVVGFIMGFAVIPIIFTITEDSLSNVPRDLTSGALALGASRWQTAIRVILPTASAGIFSAVMIGLGRAVGETMIVLMATGNTPIMNWNMFEGFRTISATIAVELPEAPQDGTLYRTLFLGGFILFLMTFIVNSLAEILRQHLRNKYKTV